jgi:hypothetical protein
VKTVWLEEIDFQAIDFNDFELEGVRTLEFSLVSRGKRDYHLTKEILGKRELNFNNEDIQLKTRVKSYSYKEPSELNLNTEVEFKVSLEELDDEGVLDVTTGLTIEVQRLNIIIKSLVKFIEDKGLISEEDFKHHHKSYIEELDQEEEYRKFYKRVFNYDWKNED